MMCSVARKYRAMQVTLFVTHVVLPEDSWKKFTGSETDIASFWITGPFHMLYTHCTEQALQTPLSPDIRDVLLVMKTLENER